jgi:hypothetical protein
MAKPRAYAGVAFARNGSFWLASASRSSADGPPFSSMRQRLSASSGSRLMRWARSLIADR